VRPPLQGLRFDATSEQDEGEDMGRSTKRVGRLLVTATVLLAATQCTRPGPGPAPTTTAPAPTTATTTGPAPTTTTTTAPAPTTTSTTRPPVSGTAISVRDGRLHDAAGRELVLRGINHPHAWYRHQTATAMPAIKATGANSVRVVLSGGRWPASDAADVAGVVGQCRQLRLVCVLENHDTTGYGEQSGAVPLSRAVDWWLSVASALQGHEDVVIVNIGNEPYGNGSNVSQWSSDTSTAIRRLRGGGIRHTIMVDAPNWGQDWSNTMRESAPSVWAVDQNIVFSIHMYGVYNTPDKVRSYLDAFISRGLPIVVGEFGHFHSDGDPDEDAILAHAQAQRIGYLGWSWSGNGGGVEYLDMVQNFDPNRLTTWGERLINGPNGIRQTSREASFR
jgi:mannan endo-1,4-beta-mannosidase